MTGPVLQYCWAGSVQQQYGLRRYVHESSSTVYAVTAHSSRPLHDKNEAFLWRHAFLPTVQNPEAFVEVGHVPDPTLRGCSIEHLFLDLYPRERIPHLIRVGGVFTKNKGFRSDGPNLRLQLFYRISDGNQQK